MPADCFTCADLRIPPESVDCVLEAGFKVPGDAVIGAGNVHYSDLLRVPLSTIDQSSTLIGEKAADLLMECIEAKKPLSARRTLITPLLIVRESSQRKLQRDKLLR
jgi:LacI family transcriptional regulator